MKILLFVLAAAGGYVAGSINPAIILSRLVYKKDIRKCGSGNPGFTNFKRSFGWGLAWLVLILDLFKAAAADILFAWLFSRSGVDFAFGAAYTGVFCLIGHVYPIWYGFSGGKGFLVCLSNIFAVDWRVGLMATGIMVVLVLTTQYMSLSTVTATLASPVLLILLGAPVPIVLIEAASAAFVAVRHRENFKRLLAGNESKFNILAKK